MNRTDIIREVEQPPYCNECDRPMSIAGNTRVGHPEGKKLWKCFDCDIEDVTNLS